VNDELREKIGVVAGMLVQEAMATGLTWEEIVAAFGLAAKATAQAAASAGDVPASECVARARSCFEDAFAQDVHVVIADGNAPERDAEADENPLLAIARRRQTSKLH
jgi:aromatic ring hydroxylase